MQSKSWKVFNTVPSPQFSSVAQWCLTLFDPMDCSTPGFLPITHSQSLLKLMSIKSVMPPKTISSSVIPFSSCLQPFPASGSFQMSPFFSPDGQTIGASASVLPMNSHDWFLLELIDLVLVAFFLLLALGKPVPTSGLLVPAVTFTNKSHNPWALHTKISTQRLLPQGNAHPAERCLRPAISSPPI